jgi:excisionase family DNA binding protein
MDNPDLLLTTKQVADRIGVSSETIARWADNGRIPCARVGVKGSWRRFRLEDVEQFERALREAS